MKLSKKILLWKDKSKIDYTPLFLSLWVAFNIWMRSKTTNKRATERDIIDSIKDIGNNLLALKNDSGVLKEEFIKMIQGESAEALTFRRYFSELHRSLENANLPYETNANGLKNVGNKKIAFSNCIIEWLGGNFQLDSLVRRKRQHNIIEIDSNFRVENNNDRLFAAYIEIVYQVRCHVVHGTLPLNVKTERVVRYTYLTLSMVMKPLGK